MAILALLSDIHGNLPALESVLKDAAQLDVTHYIVAGDMAPGPLVNEVFQRLEKLNATMILGNNEIYMLGYANRTLPAEFWEYQQFGFVRHSFELLTQRTLDVIGQLSEQCVLNIDGAAPVRVVHGSPYRIDELIYPEQDPASLQKSLAGIPESVLVCGHTHQAWVKELGDKLAINPGAVTGGLSDLPCAQYALLKWVRGSWEAELRSVSYQIELIEAAYRDTGLLAAGGGFARACIDSFRTGQNSPLAYVLYAYQIARSAGIGDEYLPDEIWKKAELEFFR